jgi:molybdenum cofactor cytidylyltransferase
MFTSVQKGVEQVRNNFFLIPGDYPLVKGETLETLLDHRGPIRVPVYQNRRGHPIYIAKELIPALLEEPPDSNLKAFRDRYDVTYIPVPDRGVVLDVDRIEDITLLQAEREE